MDTSVKLYTSDMANAPALTNANGSLIALLDAVLKDGFDVKSITSLTVAAGVATLAWTGSHSAIPHAVIVVAGVTGGPEGFADMNGEQKVQTKPSASSCTFLTSLPDGAYTGTITIKIAPLGWEKPFSSGADKAAYRSADLESTRMFLRVDDSYGTSARLVGMETMTDIDTGTGRFPTSAQAASFAEGGGWWPKAEAGAQPAPWVIVGDGRIFFYHASPYVSNGSAYNGYIIGNLRGFGDLIALRPGGDPYACMLGVQQGPGGSYPTYGTVDAGSSNMNFLPRDWTGVGSSHPNYCVPYTGSPNPVSGMDNTLGAFPSRIDGSLRLSRRFMSQYPLGDAPRADVPGVLSIPQSGLGGLEHKGLFDGTEDLAGRKLLGLIVSSGGPGQLPTPGNAGMILLDVTGPWR
ncbi:hypothetical protein [Variovorax boronicumulans]|uniref:hypothetical protein n=1 Tax=Variovorax boronicumulans TaxID=436515 RepID=UPI0024752A53|nr:hypothetical protein [Variovorax boronicumulans]